MDSTPVVAVIVAECSVVTVPTDTTNVALVAPARTVTEAGTVIAASLLANATVSPPTGAAMLRVIVPVAFVPLSMLAVNTETPAIQGIADTETLAVAPPR